MFFTVFTVSLYHIGCRQQQGMLFWSPLLPGDDPEFD